MFLVFAFILIVNYFSLLAITSFRNYGTQFDPHQQYEPVLAFFSGLFMLYFYEP